MVSGIIAGGDRALRFSVEGSEDSSENGIKDLDTFAPTPNDIVVGISAGGGAPYILALLEESQKRGVKTVGLSSNPEAKLKAFSDVFINPIVGEEAITGSSRMKSGTAQKMILNMLSTAAMVRIGKTYENYMVDVRVVNDKLHDRACRIISEISRIPYESAADYLERSGRKVKVACVMAARGCSRQEAEDILSKLGGVLRRVIG